MCLILFGIMVFAQVQAQLHPPAPTPTKASQDEQDSAAPKKSDAKPDDHMAKPKLPALDENNPTPTNRPHANASDEQHDEPTSKVWPITNAVLTLIFAGFLVVVGGLQWCAMRKQARYMRIGLRLTRTAADAAKQSADAAKQTVEEMRLEKRAWLSVHATIKPITPNQRPELEFLIENTGTTPAAIKCTKISVVQIRNPVDFGRVENMHAERAFERLRESVVAPTSKLLLKFNEDSFKLDELEAAQIDWGNHTLAVTITITYLDFTPTERRTQGCFFYDALSQSLFVHEKDNYMN